MPGLFVTFEGIDGAGKSTQIKLLKRALRKSYPPAIFTYEPGGGLGVRELLKDPLLSEEARYLILAADRIEHAQRIIRPALEMGSIVVSDRYLDSSLAYQGYGAGLPLEWLISLASGLPHPDVTFLLDLPVEDALKRIKDPDLIESRGIDYLNKVREGYLRLSQNEPTRFVVLDGTEPPEKLHDNVIGVLQALFSNEVRG